MAQSISVKSFEEVYKTAYSHGLENIYALENVDIKTVRLLKDDAKKPSEKAPRAIKVLTQPAQLQACFNFGMSYSGDIEHFVLKEPIQVLGLTRYIENSLLNQGKKVLCELLSLQAVGFGQGHIDEIQHKLKEYLAGRHLAKTRHIDFTAWLKAVVGDLDRKKLNVVLEPYGLQNLISLTSAESMELRRLTLEKRMEWREEAEKLLRTEAKKQQLDKDFCEITEVFIKPWMGWRQGMATELELLERLQNLSESGCSVQPVLDFFKDNYFKGAFPLNRYLEPLDAGLFASAGWIAEEYDQIVEKALTYFYKPSITYPFDALAGCLEREFAKVWVGFREEFISKALKLCPLLHTYKSSNGILHISLS